MRRTLAALALAASLTACAHPATRDEWQLMGSSKKRLYVSQLLGHEQSKQSKGGNQQVFRGSAAAYVQQIDAAYAKGDTRNVDAIFATFGETR